MNKKIIIPLCIIFLDIISFSFLLPSIPFIVEGFGYDSRFVGITVGLTALGMILGGFIFGKLSDIFGKKRILLITILLNLFGYILLGFSSNIIFFILARFINGLGGGGVSIVQAYIGDISDAKNRIVNMGYMGAAYGIGFVIGPALGYFIADKGIHEIAIFAIIPIVISFLACLLFFHDEQIALKEKLFPDKSPLLLRRYILYFLLSFSMTACLIGVQSIFPLYLKELFGFNLQTVYLIFGFMGITAVIYQVTMFKILQKYITEFQIMLSGMFIFPIALLSLSIVNNVVILFIFLGLLVIGLSNINNSLFSILITHGDKKNLGSIFGLNTSFTSFGDMVGGFLGGYLYILGYATPFLTFAIFLIGIYVIFYISEIQPKS